jgi:rhodanese-related sulfurtransferase
VAIKSIFEAVGRAKEHIENLDVATLKAELSDSSELLLLDIRELQERVDLGTIPGSKHVPRGMLEFWADPKSPYYRDYFTEDQRIVVFCAGGGRSALAAKALIDMGFSNVAHLEPGFGGWQKAEEPIEDVAATSRWVRRDS